MGEPGDSLWFHFSGHGTQITGELSGDESDGADEALVPAFWNRKASGLVKDDWIYSDMICKLPANCELFGLTDCCHSGTIFDLPYRLDPQNGTFQESGWKATGVTIDANTGQRRGKEPI